MQTIIFLVAVCLASVTGSPSQERIFGGAVTTISNYPFLASMLAETGGAFGHACGASIVNNRAVVTSSNCLTLPNANQYRLRVGSTKSSVGGTVHVVTAVVRHPNFNQNTLENDIGILRVSLAFAFGTNVQVARIAGFNLPDNIKVWAAGWGRTSVVGPTSDELRHVQLRIVNSIECQKLYGSYPITDDMMCAGSTGSGVCSQDYGGPLSHYGILVGVVSFNIMCGETNIPGVFTRTSSYVSWIQANA